MKKKTWHHKILWLKITEQIKQETNQFISQGATEIIESFSTLLTQIEIKNLKFNDA